MPAADLVTPQSLREWPLPELSSSKYGRGAVCVIGGAPGTPGAAMLAGQAALRTGAGRLTVAVARSVAAPVAAAMLETGVVALAETSTGTVSGSNVDLCKGLVDEADVVLLGPGLDDISQTTELLTGLLPSTKGAVVVLDAYAIGALSKLGPEPRQRSDSGELVLTPNSAEAGRLLGRDVDDLDTDVAEIAREYAAVVTCRGTIADPDGSVWRVSTGHPGLATAGSGDVLAGVVAGLLARGATPAQAVCWATYLHAAAGDRLAARVGPVGFLARELMDELPALLIELQ
jgi:ADP-dependent NAD(P)H-hydrate dehydratase